MRAAGEVVRAVVEGLGIGGGHRSMAKGIIPLQAFRKTYGSATLARIREVLHDAFVAAIESRVAGAGAAGCSVISVSLGGGGVSSPGRAASPRLGRAR